MHRISGVDHPATTHIYSDMTGSGYFIGSLEKDKISGLCF
jgi:hypothetical protein